MCMSICSCIKVYIVRTHDTHVVIYTLLHYATANASTKRTEEEERKNVSIFFPYISLFFYLARSRCHCIACFMIYCKTINTRISRSTAQDFVTLNTPNSECVFIYVFFSLFFTKKKKLAIKHTTALAFGFSTIFFVVFLFKCVTCGRFIELHLVQTDTGLSMSPNW